VLEQMKYAARKEHIHLFYLDESGMSNVPNVQRAWSPLGVPHSADASASRRRVNILGALDYGKNQLEHVLHQGSVKRDNVIAFIDQLAMKYVGKPIIVVLDNASMHHNIDEEKEREWLVKYQLTLWHLPAYSPELNLIEMVWKHAKYHWRKFTTWSKENLFDEVQGIFQQYGSKYKITYA
jgi:transposase